MILRSVPLLSLSACLLLIACGIDDDPVAPAAQDPTDLTVQLNVQPLSSLRTLDTWANWTIPVEVTFLVEASGAPDTGGHHKRPEGEYLAVLRKSEEGHEDTLQGSIVVQGMGITVRVEDPLTMWEPQHGGEMVEHHAEQGEHHVTIEVVDASTDHHPHGGPTISHCGVHLIAVSAGGDEFELELVGVQGGHGFRYEANGALPEDTYDLHLEIEPPQFYRDQHTVDKWTTHIEAEFHDFILDDSFSGGTIGSSTWVGAAGDSLLVTLRGGSVKTYGAVGIGAIPLRGDETINFSVRLEDPTREAHAQPLFGASIQATVINNSSGETVLGILEPMFGEHGFHFAQNWNLGLEHGGGGEDEGHGHAK